MNRHQVFRVPRIMCHGVPQAQLFSVHSSLFNLNIIAGVLLFFGNAWPLKFNF